MSKKTVIKRPKMVRIKRCEWCKGLGWVNLFGGTECSACGGEGGEWEKQMIVVEVWEEQ